MKQLGPLLILFLALLPGLCYAEANAPNAVTTEHFTTTGAGFTATLDSKLGPTISYVISYKIIKPFGEKVFCEFEFQNPAEDYEYVSSTRYIAADETEFAEMSPALKIPKQGKIYYITLRIYRDDTKKELLAEHVQPVQAPNTYQNELSSDLWDSVAAKTQGLRYWAMDLASEPWKAGHSQKAKDQEVIEYVLDGESVLNWRELITEHNFYTPLDVKAAADNFISSMKLKFPSFQAQVLERDQDRILVEWWQTENTGYGPEHALLLLQSHLRGLYTISSISYAHKGPRMDNELRRKWIERFSAAKLMDVTQ